MKTTALAFAGVLLMTACSGSGPTGLGARPAEEIVRVADTAADEATSVHVQGTWVSQGEEYRIDVRLNREGGVGTVVTSIGTVELLRVGEELFVRGDGRLYEPRDGRGGADVEASAEVLRDKFVKVPDNDPSFARLSGFTRMREMLSDLVRLNGKLKKDGRKKVRGVDTFVVAADNGRGGEVFVAVKGKPYPMRYNPAPNAGSLDLFEYDQAFPLALPKDKDVVDYGTLTDGREPEKPDDGDGHAH